MRKDLDDNKDKIISSLKDGTPRMEICRQFKCKYDTLKFRLEKWGVSHLKNPQRKGIQHKEVYRPAKLYLKLNGPFIRTHTLKEKLWRDSLKPKYCELCRWAEYSIDGRLPLELDHINGNRYDNRLENLRILCPNCHSLQTTNSGLNIGAYS